MLLPIADYDSWWKYCSFDDIVLTDSSISIKTHKTDESTVTVYLMDSGIDIDHIEFTDRNIKLLYSHTDNDFSDSIGTGTAMASLIIGKTCGVNDVLLKVVKANIDSYMSAILAIISDIQNNPKGIKIVNIGFNIPKNIEVEKKLQELIDNGVVIVAASGDATIEHNNTLTPASMKDVIVVGSYDTDFEPVNTSHGQLSAWAPGVHIKVAQPNNLYTFSSGTNLSSAIHSAALVYGLYDFKINGYSFINLIKTNKDIKKIYFTNSVVKRNLLSLNNEKAHNNYKGSMNHISTFFEDRKNKTLYYICEYINNYILKAGEKIDITG